MKNFQFILTHFFILTLFNNVFNITASYPVQMDKTREVVRLPANQTSIDISCSATGDPFPLIEWKKNNQSVTFRDKEYTGREININYTRTSFLQISQPDSSIISVVYTCIATNYLPEVGIKTITVIFDRNLVKPKSTVRIAIGIICFLVFVSICLTLEFWQRRKIAVAYRNKLLAFVEGYLRHTQENNNNNCVPLKKLHLSNITTGKNLGSGNFGVVMEGTYRGMKVAVKMSKHLSINNFNDPGIQDFLKEMSIMNYVASFDSHENVVRFIGGVVKGTGQNCIVLEHCEYRGICDLKTYLSTNKSGYIRGHLPVVQPYVGAAIASDKHEITRRNLIQWCFEIASGMEHLGTLPLPIIHRDLALRNILLDENGVAKVSDFGISRQVVKESDVYTAVEGGVPRPLRWLAPETLVNDQMYSINSDIFAYGITMWEIFTLGDSVPYSDIPNSNTLHVELRDFLESGRRLQRPFIADVEIYEIMRSCWKTEPSERSRFSQIKTTLNDVLRLFESATG